MKNIFPGIIVVTLESQGCLYEHEGRIKIMPSYQVTAVDSTGAGDIFHGAFVYGLAKGWEFERIIRISNLAGALSVTKLGSSLSIPSIDEMKAVSHEFE
ncbi:putative phosphofructokinase PfkB [compost metagenome]